VQHVLFVDYQPAQITDVEAVIVQSIGGNLWIMIPPSAGASRWALLVSWLLEQQCFCCC
jgi:hypothetical protein